MRRRRADWLRDDPPRRARRSVIHWSLRWSAGGPSSARDGRALEAGRKRRAEFLDHRNFSQSLHSGSRALWHSVAASLVNGLISLCIGLLIATVGVDSIYGAERLAFGVAFLQDGIEFLLVMVGAYGIGEVLTRLASLVLRRRPAKPAAPTARLLRRRFRGSSETAGFVYFVSYVAPRPASPSVSCRAQEPPCLAFVAYGIERPVRVNGNQRDTSSATRR